MHVVRRLCSFSLMFSRVRVSGFGSRVPPGFRVWLQGFCRVWFQGLVWRVWALRFGVSGLSLEGLGSKVWGFRVSFSGFGLQGLGLQGFVWRVLSPRFRVWLQGSSRV